VNFTAPSVTNGQAAIVLRGEPGVSYVVQSSPDLQNWAPVATNSDSTITRTITFPAPDGAGFYRVSRDVLPRFDCAIAAQYNIQLNGGGAVLVTDSFNSADTNLSTNGQYDPTKASTNGNVASLYGPLNIGNYQIKGNLCLGPSVNPALIGPGSVTGTVRNDFNTCFPDVTLPWALVGPPPAPIVTNAYVFATSGAYKILNGNWPIIVLPGVSVQLRVDATSFNPANVHIMMDTYTGISGTLSLYQVAGSVTLGGNVTVDSGYAGNFYYWGMTGVTSISCSGSSTFIGTIYAPEANVTLSGGSGANNYVGALIVRSLTMIGHFAVHFDERLPEYGPRR
jgi:hypothetical protein